MSYCQKNNKHIYIDRLFPSPPNNNYGDLKIDYDSISYITSPYYSDIITSIIDSNMPDDISRTDITIFDGTACVGGNSISFGKTFGFVIAVEIDKYRYEMLSNNLMQYHLCNVIPVNNDCTTLFKKINMIDVMYFDPPWGGKNYKNMGNIRLTIGNMYIDEIVNEIFCGNIRSNVKLAVFKLPKNYNLEELYYLTIRTNLIMLMYELKKMIIVVFKKI